MRTQMSGLSGIGGLKWLLMLAVATAGLLASRDAAAQACTNDDDCTADLACGGPVCTWPAMTCTPAGTAKKGEDGWCMTDDDCKCKGMGATCVAVFCTFTRPCDAPGAPGCSGGGGSSGTGTGGAGSGGSSGTGTGGSSGTGTGGSSGTGTGGAAPPAGGDGGGCAIGGAASSSLLGSMLALAALAVARRRRQRT